MREPSLKLLNLMYMLGKPLTDHRCTLFKFKIQTQPYFKIQTQPLQREVQNNISACLILIHNISLI